MVVAILLGVSAWVLLIALVGALCVASQRGDALVAGAREHPADTPSRRRVAREPRSLRRGERPRGTVAAESLR